MSIFENHQVEIAQEIKEEIESGRFHAIPTISEYLTKNQSLQNELLQSYIEYVAPQQSTDNPLEVLQRIGVSKDVALLQAVLNDTVVISERHKLYTNNAHDLLGVSDNNAVRADRVLMYNRKGMCRSYEITTGKTHHMEKGVGLIFSREKFTAGLFWVYAVARIYIEYILMYATKFALKMESENSSANFTFNDKIKERFGTDTGNWDRLHNRLTDLDEVFNVRTVLNETAPCYVGYTDANGRLVRVDMLKEWTLTPCFVEDVYSYYGWGIATDLDMLCFLFTSRTRNLKWDYYKDQSEIYAKDITSVMTRSSVYKKLREKYTRSEKINRVQAVVAMENGRTVVIKKKGNHVDFYKTKGMSKGEVADYRKAVEENIDSQEIEQAIASAQVGGYELEELCPFIRQDVIEVWSATEKNKNILIAQDEIEGIWLLC